MDEWIREIVIIFLGMFIALVCQQVVKMWRVFSGKTSLSDYISKRRLLKKMREENISNIFFSRSDIRQRRKESKMLDYIKTAKNSFCYVGMYFPMISESHDEIYSTIYCLLNKGVRISFFQYDYRRINEMDITESISEYYGISAEDIKLQIMSSKEEMEKILKRLPEHLLQFLSINWHKVFLTSSAFIFDENSKSPRFYVDIKMFGLGKDESFSMELKPTSKRDSLYYRMLHSFNKVRNNIR